MSARTARTISNQGSTNEQTPLLIPTSPISNIRDASHQDEQGSPDDDKKRTSNDGFKIAAAMYSFVVMGHFVSSMGAMLPHIKQHYHLNDFHASSIFLVPPIGYTIGAASNHSIHARFGQRGIAVLGPILKISAAVGIAAHPAFGLLLAAFAVLATGSALLDGSWCAWVGAMKNANTLSGLLHGSFSAGAAVGPVLAGWIMERGKDWWVWYYVLVGASTLEFFVLAFAFRHETAAEYHRAESNLDLGANNTTTLRDIFRHPATWVSSLYFLVYVGNETAISGWIVSFMLRGRHTSMYTANLSSSGYWAGMAVGRLVLGHLTDRIGVRRGAAIYLSIAMFLQFIFNIIYSPVVSIMLMALLGFCMGPLFPSGIVVLTTLLPSDLHVNAVSFVAAVGQIGGAALPFAIGAVVEFIGIGGFRWVILGSLGISLVVWVLFSQLRRKSQEVCPATYEDGEGDN